MMLKELSLLIPIRASRVTGQTACLFILLTFACSPVLGQKHKFVELQRIQKSNSNTELLFDAGGFYGPDFDLIRLNGRDPDSVNTNRPFASTPSPGGCVVFLGYNAGLAFIKDGSNYLLNGPTKLLFAQARTETICSGYADDGTSTYPSSWGQASASSNATFRAKFPPNLGGGMGSFLNLRALVEISGSMKPRITGGALDVQRPFCGVIGSTSLSVDGLSYLDFRVDGRSFDQSDGFVEIAIFNPRTRETTYIEPYQDSFGNFIYSTIVDVPVWISQNSIVRQSSSAVTHNSNPYVETNTGSSDLTVSLEYTIGTDRPKIYSSAEFEGE